MIIRMQKPTLVRKDMDAVLQTMVDEHIGPGGRTESFISQLKQYTMLDGTAVALRSLPEALAYALRLFGVSRGDRVVVSALSPNMYASVAAKIGCDLLIGDIDPSTGNLSYEEALKLCGQQPKAILLYEPSGNFPFGKPWKDLGVPIIEDITESLGSAYQDMKSGLCGDVAVCAFEESGIISTGGGAVILSKNPALQEKLDGLMAAEISYAEMSDMNAALGIVQLTLVEKYIARRRSLFRTYQQALMRTKHRLFGIPDIDYDTNGYAFTVVLDSKAEDVMKFALKYEITTERTFSGCLIGDQVDRFDLYPNALPCMMRAISFPLYPFLTNQQAAQIEKVISHLP